MLPPGYGSRPAMEPILIMSPAPPFGRVWKMGRIACVMLIKPVTLVANMILMSSSAISGAFATPFTKPLYTATGQQVSQNGEIEREKRRKKKELIKESPR